MLGTIGTIDADGFTIAVLVLRTRSVFGRDDVEVTPVNGQGVRWIHADRLRVSAQADDALRDALQTATHGGGARRYR